MLAVALALGTAIAVNQLTAEARRLRDAYGATLDVAVVADDVEVGRRIADVAELRAVPIGVVPDGALVAIEDDAVAAVPLTAGTMVTRPHVRNGTALAADEAALALPVGPTTPVLSAGALVIILSAADPFAPGPTTQVSARVLEAGAAQVLVAVHLDDLPAATTAVASGTVTLALRGT